MSVATALLCPDVLPIVSSRISVAGRSRSTPVDACGIEGACGGTFHLRGWWALLIAAHEPDPRSIRQNYVISSSKLMEAEAELEAQEGEATMMSLMCGRHI